MKKFLSALKIFAGIFLGCMALLVIVGFVEAYVLMHPQRILTAGGTLLEKHIVFQALDLVTDDGVHLATWYTPPKPALSGVEGNGSLVLLAHGHGDNRPEWMYVMFVKAGYGVLAWDARAHGSSGGDFSTLGYQEVLDVKAALDFAKKQPEVKHIGGWGGSMGAATLIRAAAQFPEIEALAVDSPYVSLDEQVDYLVPYPLANPLAKFLLRLKLGVDLNDGSPGALIGKISPRPVYLIEGDGDRVTPPDAAQELYNAAGEPRWLWTEKDVTHMAMYLDNPRKYERRVVGFFDEYLLGK
jgi:fermentation-respiration switch protein FrsA (DUF1100 family)